MIGSLKGRIEYKATDHTLIDVSGVGYLVYCSERTLSLLPSDGEYVTIFTELVVREDLLQLYGCLTFAEKEWHRLLCSVQGVGAKGALAIQGILSVEALSRAILLSDWATVKSAPGVGPKIAQRIVNELKEKAPKVMAMGAVTSNPIDGNTDLVDHDDRKNQSEIIDFYQNAKKYYNVNIYTDRVFFMFDKNEEMSHSLHNTGDVFLALNKDYFPLLQYFLSRSYGNRSIDYSDLD